MSLASKLRLHESNPDVQSDLYCVIAAAISKALLEIHDALLFHIFMPRVQASKTAEKTGRRKERP